MTVYQDSAGVFYMGRFPIPVTTESEAFADLKTIFESKPGNSLLSAEGRLRVSFDGQPVSAVLGQEDFHISDNNGNSVKLSTSFNSEENSSNYVRFDPSSGYINDVNYAVFAKGVLAIYASGEVTIRGQAEVSAFPSPLNRFYVDATAGIGKWVNQVDANSLGDLYVSELEASFPINCSGGGTADATWLKLLDKATGKAMGICEGSVMQTKGTNFTKGEFVQVDAPLPDGGSRIFICGGSWGSDGQILLRSAPIDAQAI